MIPGTVVVVLAALILAAWIGAQRQQRALSAQIDHLIRIGSEHGATISTTAHIDNLPPPVARYLQLALPTPRHIEEVRIQQIGTLRTGIASERWMPFDAEHIVIPGTMATNGGPSGGAPSPHTVYKAPGEWTAAGLPRPVAENQRDPPSNDWHSAARARSIEP